MNDLKNVTVIKINKWTIKHDSQLSKVGKEITRYVYDNALCIIRSRYRVSRTNSFGTMRNAY